MTKTITIGLWAALLAAVPSAGAQEAAAKAPEAVKPAGQRLRVRFQETRLRGESTTATSAYNLLLHAGAEGARAFVGTQARITVADKQARATLFKNAGVEARAKVEALPDGRYRVDAKYERSSVLGAGGGEGTPVVATDNPILRVVRGESTVLLREGETVAFASAVDAVSGEVVRVDLTVTAAPVPTAPSGAGPGDARLLARLVLVRRQGEAKVARRPYSLVLQGGGGEAANVFSGSMLPLQVSVDGKPTVALKDVGAGLRLTARPAPVPDGRHRLDVSFSDGTLSARRGPDLSPQVRTFESESQLFVQEGETLTVASVVDPDSGESLEAELTVDRVP
jgi:hypothetical protein